MSKLLWLGILVLPIWAAAHFGAPKWLSMVLAMPFFVYAETLRDPEENLLGEGFASFRPWLLVLLGLGGLVLGGVLLLVAKAMMR